ncbi:hypothetical protein FCK90_05005 [Kocuria coralli]|uniref:DUF4287 domain-containing protein n=1 Tax=Kocuria coralli TaxID=1461025 RepID=A0A5J5L1Q3_9MICC|nr:hypothetical protein [Kocuria coralli]KAA9394891.1 hypothetical protein FCK90_05005 [Kocuria coralli]
MTPARPATPPSRAAAIEKATGLAWSEWARILDDAGGDDLPHNVLADAAYKAMPASVPNTGWWAQSVAVAYEQWIGRRIKGQAHDGTFQVSATRTLPGTMREVFDRWCEAAGDLGELDGLAVTDGPRTSGTGKRLHWGVTFADGSRGSVDVSPKESKDDPKVLVAASHVNLASPDDLERWRAIWKDRLKEL